MITMKDIARSTGFSIATVSAVLRDKDAELCIRPSTAEQVRKVARELGYRRSDAALQMQSGKSRNIIQFLPEDCGDFFLAAALRTTDSAATLGYSMREIFHGGDDGRFEELVNQTLGQWPAAYLTWSSGSKCRILRRIAGRHGIPVIALGFAEESATASVRSDDADGIRRAVGHLVELGHRKIGHATDDFTARYALERYEFWRQALAEHGIPCREEWCFHANSLTCPEALTGYAERLAVQPDRPTAIVCGSDYVALRVMMACLAAGLGIPRDISVVGYGGLAIADHCIPRLTTVVQPFERFGEIAIETLRKLGERQSCRKHWLLPTELRVGQSTRPMER